MTTANAVQRCGTIQESPSSICPLLHGTIDCPCGCAPNDRNSPGERSCAGERETRAGRRSGSREDAAFRDLALPIGGSEDFTTTSHAPVAPAPDQLSEKRARKQGHASTREEPVARVTAKPTRMSPNGVSAGCQAVLQHREGGIAKYMNLQIKCGGLILARRSQSIRKK